jgi:hypothetical protein
MLNTYRRIETEEITTLVNTLLAKQGITEQVEANLAEVDGKSTTHRVKYTLHSLKQRVNGDTIAPQIYIFNSHNKECRFKIYVGFLRFVCMNGMVLGDILFDQTITHRTGPVCEAKLDGLERGLADALDYIQAGFANDVEELTNQELTEGQMIQVTGNLPLSNRIKDKVIDRIVLQHTRRFEDQSNNVWALWNLTNEVIGQHTTSELRRDQRNVNLLGDIVALTEPSMEAA